MRTWARKLLLLGLLVHAGFLTVSIAGTQIGLGLAFAGLAWSWACGERPMRTPLDLPLLAFICAAAASDLLAPVGPPSLAFATLWRSAASFWIAAQALTSLPAAERTRWLGWLLGAVAVGAAAAACVGLWQFRTGLDPVHALHLRAQPYLVQAPGVPDRYAAVGFYISRLTFGHALVFALSPVAAVCAAAALPRRPRLWLALACALGLGAVVTTFGRAAWFGALAAACVAGACLGSSARDLPQRRRATGRAALALGLGLCALWLLAPVRSRFLSGFELTANGDRLFLWSRAREVIADHPWLGVGFGNYPRICSAYYDRVDPTFFMRTWAHNSVLSLWAEMGPLGPLLTAWIFWAAARSLLRALRGPPLSRALAAGALGSLAAAAVVAQFHDVIYDTKAMYPLWLSLGLAWGAAAPARSASYPPVPPAA